MCGSYEGGRCRELAQDVTIDDLLPTHSNEILSWHCVFSWTAPRLLLLSNTLHLGIIYEGKRAFIKMAWFRIRVCGRILHVLNLFQDGTKYVLFIIDGNNNFYPRTAHEGLEGEKIYSSNLSFTSELLGGGWLTPRPALFTLEKIHSAILYEAGWVLGPTGRG